MLVDGHNYKGVSLSNQFNQNFLSVGESSKSQDRSPNPLTFLTSFQVRTIFLTPTTAEEITQYIMHLKDSSAAEVDNIKPQTVKAVCAIIAPVFSHICDVMLKEGIFPQQLKIARISVIHKGGCHSDFNNYRPIPVLSVFAKIGEEVINTRLVNFLSEISAIVNAQHGLQRGKSTGSALTNIKDTLLNNIESKFLTIGLFLDFRKAFDSVNQNILLSKLQYYGIRGTPLQIITSYLESRKQCTIVNGIPSEFGTIRTGVPQGSIPGPFYF